jgi:hypothetical protein
MSSSIETTDFSENVESSQNEINDPILELISKLQTIDNGIINSLKDVIKDIKEKSKVNKELSQKLRKQKKELEKFEKKKKSHSGGGGLSVLIDISSDLKEFLTLEDKQYSRGEITKILSAYCKEHLKKNEKNKLIINKKTPIYKILKAKIIETDDDGKDVIKGHRDLDAEEYQNINLFGSINKYIQHHFIKNK